MRLLLLLASLPLFAADSADFVVWKAADLKGYEKTLHAKLDAEHTANQRLPDYEGHAVFVVHREGTGPVEAHRTIAHLIYVISGEATLVVGGTMVDEKTLEPEQIRGTSVNGGETRKVAAGDVLHIPAKAPHWFKVAPGTQITCLMLNLESK
jgi:quercetin dioxygenase-like cupin family protein